MRLKALHEKVMAQGPESRGREGGHAPALSLTHCFLENVDAVRRHSTVGADPAPTQLFRRAIQ
jgi:hypothetical protein